MNKCYLCGKEAKEERHIIVDVEADHDIDCDTGETVWYSHPIYSDEWLCAEHIEALENGEGEFDPYKHKEDY
jgi:hypothetical protein